MKNCSLILFLLTLTLAIPSCSWFNNNTKKYSPAKGIQTVTAEYFNFNYPFDPVQIRSVGTYTILLHLTRTLVVLDKDLQYQGDLAASWSISEDNTKYLFNLKGKQFFSNGDPINSEAIACSIERQAKHKNATHFDFSRIKSISTTDDSVTIKLNHPMPNFIHQLLHPEFGVLHINDCQKAINKIDFSITSGPYTLKNGAPGKVKLLKNTEYPKHSGPGELNILATKNLNYTTALSSNTDFAVATSRTDFAEIHKLEAAGKVKLYKPHYGFSYWLSLNEFHPDLKSIKNRVSLLNILRKNYIFPLEKKRENTWRTSEQLYLPDGGGRLNKSELKSIWKSHLKKQYKFSPKTINLLISSNTFLDKPVVAALKKTGKKINITKYKNLREFEKLSRSGRKKYHLIQINNDFSSYDLYENIQVSLNPTRPLIFLDESFSDFNNLLEELGATADSQLRYQVTKNIEEKLLKQAHIFPLAIYNVIYIHKTNISLDNWSRYYPEVSFWKVK